MLHFERGGVVRIERVFFVSVAALFAIRINFRLSALIKGV